MSCHSLGRIRSLFSVLTILTALSKGIILPHLPTCSWYYHQKTCCFGLPWANYKRHGRIPDLSLWNRVLDMLDIMQEEAIQTSHVTLPAHINLFDSNFCFLGSFTWRQLLCQYFLSVMHFIVPQGWQIPISHTCILIITVRNWRWYLQKKTESSLFLVKA